MRNDPLAVIARFSLLLALLFSGSAIADKDSKGKDEDQGERITQEAIVSGDVRLSDLHAAGLKMFASRFTKDVGYGDGPMNIVDTVSPGGRPTLQGNGSLLRINGLDAQSCVECHSVIRADTIPPVFGLGGAGGSVTNAIIMPTAIDPADLEDFDSNAGMNGRFANPPFLFGVGAVELLAIEMTMDLQAQAQFAVAHPGSVVELRTKGVSFGNIVADTSGDIDYDAIEGVDRDLVVKPFGRKGEFATVREFDVGAMQFHFGMQPTEAVGVGVDADGDGVVDEVLVGELSALSAFITMTEPPIAERMDSSAERGFATFSAIGCASCHQPSLSTVSKSLPLRFPELPTDPTANVFTRIDLTKSPTDFRKNHSGGIDVPLFSDLKRHDMGDGLAESFARADDIRNREFTTGKLWGIADSAPYLHDGRASTLEEAIVFHGGEAQAVREAFEALPERDHDDLMKFLGTLRTPLPSQKGSGGDAERRAPESEDQPDLPSDDPTAISLR